MRYRIVLKPIHNKTLLKALSEKIASKEHLPQVQVLRELMEGNYVYASELLKEEVVLTAQKLRKLHIEFDVVKEEEPHPDTTIFVPKDSNDEAPVNEELIEPGIVRMPSRERITHKETPPKEHIPVLPHNIDKEHHEANLRALYGLDQVPIKKEKTPLPIIFRNVAILLLIFGLILFIANRTDSTPTRPTEGKMSAQSKENRSKEKAKPSTSTKSKSDKTAQASKNQQKPKSAEEAEEIKEKADDLCGKDGDQATKLYRVALSFNRKNIDAWYGLLNCYKENNMTREIIETEEEMRKLFGKEIFSIEKLVSSYGILEEYHDDAKGAFVRYRSSSSGATLMDIYKLSLALSNTCRGEKITIYATNADGSGYLVTIQSRPFPRGFKYFKESAQIDAL